MNLEVFNFYQLLGWFVDEFDFSIESNSDSVLSIFVFISFEIFIPRIDKHPAKGIAIKGAALDAMFISFETAIKLLPLKSPNLEINVSIKTVDLYLSFFLNELKIVSLVGLFMPYSKILNTTVTIATETIEGINP